MTSLREAAQQALEALELAQTDVHWELNSPTRKFLRKAEKSLRAALAEPVQEPIGVIRTLVQIHADGTETWREEPVWNVPPQRLPLTEEEIGIICASLGFAQISPVEVARAIERAHGIT